MNHANHETSRTLGTRQPYEPPQAIFASPEPARVSATDGNYPRANSPCGDCDPPQGNFPSSNSPCGSC